MQIDSRLIDLRSLFSNFGSYANWSTASQTSENCWNCSKLIYEHQTKQTFEQHEPQCGSAIEFLLWGLGALPAGGKKKNIKLNKEIIRPSVTIKRRACGAFLYLLAGFHNYNKMWQV